MYTHRKSQQRDVFTDLEMFKCVLRDVAPKVEGMNNIHKRTPLTVNIPHPFAGRGWEYVAVAGHTAAVMYTFCQKNWARSIPERAHENTHTRT